MWDTLVKGSEKERQEISHTDNRTLMYILLQYEWVLVGVFQHAPCLAHEQQTAYNTLLTRPTYDSQNRRPFCWQVYLHTLVVFQVLFGKEMEGGRSKYMYNIYNKHSRVPGDHIVGHAVIAHLLGFQWWGTWDCIFVLRCMSKTGPEYSDPQKTHYLGQLETFSGSTVGVVPEIVGGGENTIFWNPFTLWTFKKSEMYATPEQVPSTPALMTSWYLCVMPPSLQSPMCNSGSVCMYCTGQGSANATISLSECMY